MWITFHRCEARWGNPLLPVPGAAGPEVQATAGPWRRSDSPNRGPKFRMQRVGLLQGLSPDPNARGRRASVTSCTPATGPSEPQPTRAQQGGNLARIFHGPGSRRCRSWTGLAEPYASPNRSSSSVSNTGEATMRLIGTTCGGKRRTFGTGLPCRRPTLARGEALTPPGCSHLCTEFSTGVHNLRQSPWGVRLDRRHDGFHTWGITCV
jgi:hypothetical protein